MIHEEICTYEVCKLAKEKGFPQHPTESDGECYYHWDRLRKIHSLCSSKVYYDDEFRHRDLFRAPTQSILSRWLREKKVIDIEITVAIAFDSFNGFHRQYDCQIKSPRKGEPIFVVGGLFSYELALEDALKYALENLV